MGTISKLLLAVLLVLTFPVNSQQLTPDIDQSQELTVVSSFDTQSFTLEPMQLEPTYLVDITVTDSFNVPTYFSVVELNADDVLTSDLFNYDALTLTFNSNSSKVSWYEDTSINYFTPVLNTSTGFIEVTYKPKNN